jgi:hypothetical protein
MKILLLHNIYGSSAPSGESSAIPDETALLRRNGHHAVEPARHSDEIKFRGMPGEMNGADQSARHSR